ncbi:imidazole glycerol phosphate synthase subunit HisH [Weissella sp. GP1]|uniref:imidazole glycerol phosphate synthase subunit HisH n=1 Tax=Weissella confusa TaxID=1583 RepID=UPI001092D63D|nr:imidazole glycerol phosphate synthase subunit HisH [Weissella confusa]MBJ7693898.1 imidazole glycerol phosphate synthase subunit HisH [Weissella confusa]QBZ05603.1 imidazole glycerol phosphate synthase subunit HisH [Weissella confusa]
MAVAIIDYGAGNVQNVMKALKVVGVQGVLTRETTEIMKADGIIIPGVGAFKSAKQQLDQLGLTSIIQDYARDGKPVLGVCLGMQMLFDRSTEFGETTGLGLIPGSVVELPEQENYKVPQMGWNKNRVYQALPLADQLADKYTYFVHSYYVNTVRDYIVADVAYGDVAVPSVVRKGNVIGTQFHPEKSGEVGLSVWRAFAKMVTA